MNEWKVHNVKDGGGNAEYAIVGEYLDTVPPYYVGKRSGEVIIDAGYHMYKRADAQQIADALNGCREKAIMKCGGAIGEFTEALRRELDIGTGLNVLLVEAGMSLLEADLTIQEIISSAAERHRPLHDDIIEMMKGGMDAEQVADELKRRQTSDEV